jgi:hypothetical protein
LPGHRYIINLDGGVTIAASDGEASGTGAGAVILMGDIHGKGHPSQSIGGTMRHSIVAPIADTKVISETIRRHPEIASPRRDQLSALCMPSRHSPHDERKAAHPYPALRPLR